MNRIFKTWLGFASMVCALLCLPQTAKAAEDEPIIEFKTAVAQESDQANTVTILIGGFKAETDYIDLDCGAGLEEHELNQATFDKESGAWTGGTSVSCTVDASGTVKIYGDADNIAVINFEGCYITNLKMAKMPNLYYINLDHNYLQELDLSDFSGLQYITVADNPFDVKPLKIGGNKPNLQLLAIGQTENIDPSFNLSDYPSIVSFDAYACKGLKTLDTSGCPDLQQLSLDGTQLTTLDVSNNPFLTILNISDTNISDIDISGLDFLQQFYADRQGTQTKLKKLDVTKNTSLVYLFAAGNNLTEVDLTNNKYLQQLYLADNLLTDIDLSKNTNLINVILRNNCFTFATLPEPQGTWSQYDYYQRNMAIANTVKVGDVLDFSDKVLREGTTTTCAVFEVNEDELTTTALDESYYTYADGKVTFLKAPENYVYIAFANDMFPELQLDYMPMRTEKFTVKSAEDFGKPDLAFSFNAKIGSTGADVKLKIGVAGATEASPKKFYVDFGDGVMKEFAATTETIPEAANAEANSKLGTVTVYVEQGEQLSALCIDAMQLNNIDLSAARSLLYLKLVDTNLYEIDLGYNKLLKSLVLNGNHFANLNIRGVNDFYQKNYLQDIDLSNNDMFTVTLNDMGTIHNLNLSNNALEEVSFKDADYLETLDISNNYFTSVDVNYSTLLTKLNISNNNIANVVLPTELSLKEFDCSNNNLSFATLPLLSGLEQYSYAPQNNVEVAAMAPGIDLESHNVNSNTTYVWKLSDGTTLVNGTDYSIVNGMTRFLSPVFGKYVYCEMTNPAFPGLVLTTSLVEAKDMPTHKIATFTTLEDGDATMVLRASSPTTICIDWKGGGVSVETYAVDDNLNIQSVKTHAGGECTVYAYEEKAPLYVFNLTNAKLSDVDLTNMTELTLVNIDNAGISDIKLPNSTKLAEIKLNNNNIESLDLSKYAGQLFLLSMNNNKLTTMDVSKFNNLRLLYLANNQLESVSLDNRELFDLDLSGNQLKSLDVSKLPELYQLFLSNNHLSSLNVAANNKLSVLHIDKNNFRFSTLPLPTYQDYQYGEQEHIDITVDANGVVDLSSEKEVDGTATTFRWFVGEPWYDEDTGELTGEELYVDDEYYVKDGVTTFATTINNVVCAMLNDKFPNLTVYCNPIDVTSVSAVEGITADQLDGKARIYTIDGVELRNAKTVKPGLYLVKKNNATKKMVVK